MARRADEPERSSWREVAVVAAVALAAIVALVVVTGMVASGGAPPALETGPPDVAAIASPGTGSPEASNSGRPSAPAESRAPGHSGSTGSHGPTAPTDGLPTPAATPTPTPVAGGAPAAPTDFDLERQAIPMGFPLLHETRYHYRDNFLDPRDGLPDAYNHARTRPDGTVIRLHDGIDIYADEGEPLAAVFAGTVIEPSTLWQPWEPERYGKVVVIRSDEPGTQGYIALYAHANRIWVDVGAHVTRGQVIGTVGRTGNAELQSIHPHVHFELRAPFALDWSSLGEATEIDAFNPYPSLRLADPKRR